MIVEELGDPDYASVPAPLVARVGLEGSEDRTGFGRSVRAGGQRRWGDCRWLVDVDVARLSALLAAPCWPGAGLGGGYAVVVPPAKRLVVSPARLPRVAMGG